MSAIGLGLAKRATFTNSTNLACFLRRGPGSYTFSSKSFYTSDPASKAENANPTSTGTKSSKPAANPSFASSSTSNRSEILNVNSSEYFDWSSFFKLRKTRRVIEVLASIPSAFVGMGMAGAYLSAIPLGSLEVINNIDPMIVVAGGVVLSGGLSYLLGGYLGSFLWKLFNRSQLVKMSIKEADYFNHIKNNRSDPRLSSYRNPLPDYYGEKISSVKDYRKWVKKQRRHERNGTSILVENRK